jgi:hypothetical protein
MLRIKSSDFGGAATGAGSSISVNVFETRRHRPSRPMKK